MGRRSLTLALCALFAGIAPTRADYVVAPDIVVFCEPTLRHAITDVGAQWRKETGIPVRVFASPTEAELEQVWHHARSDLILGEGDALAKQAVDRRLVKPDTLHRLWRNALVLARKADGTNAITLAAVAGKAPIAVVDSATAAGTEGKKALRSLGLWDAVDHNSIGVVDTADASYLLETGKVQLALVYATDVAANPALAVGVQLPAESYGPIVYWVGETQNALSPNTDRFMSYLGQAQAQQLLTRHGLEVLP
jgi:molybdate transport system substrate-binding protein